MEDLRVPKDAYDLLYRLGQKSVQFDRMKVEYFAPYLLKEGVVQRVQVFPDPLSSSEVSYCQTFKVHWVSLI